jgi:DNA invertase Pin-like site-specific DNA recombinase
MQRAAIERAARTRGDTIAGWYSDKQSARTIARPGLEKLRQAAREGRVPRLYVCRLDRLARSGIRDTFEVIEELRGHQCELITVADGFDLAGPAAEVVLAVMAWAAKIERLAINERIAAARLRHLLGPPSAPIAARARLDRGAPPPGRHDPRDRHRSTIRSEPDIVDRVVRDAALLVTRP